MRREIPPGSATKRKGRRVVHAHGSVNGRASSTFASLLTCAFRSSPSSSFPPFSCWPAGLESASSDEPAPANSAADDMAETNTPLTLPDLPDSLDRAYPDEVHLDNVRQLTYGGDNAEAYWSFDGRNLVFQATNTAWAPSDQMMDLADGTPSSTPPAPSARASGGQPAPISCPETPRSSTPRPTPPTQPARKPRRGPNDEYVWPIYAGYDIYTVPVGGGEPTLLIGGEGYDAEATVSRKETNRFHQHPPRRPRDLYLRHRRQQHPAGHQRTRL